MVHQKNGGLSAARNTGLANAKGKYVGFVDSDDIIAPTMYEKLLWAMKKTSADMAACEFTRSRESLFRTSNISAEQLHQVKGVDGCMSVIVETASARAFTWTDCMVWNKLYLREKMPQFALWACLGEDILFNYQYVQNIEKMVIVPEAMYFYRENPMSITGTRSLAKDVINAKVWCMIADDLQTDNIELMEYCQGTSAYMTHNVAWNIISSGEETMYTEFINETRRRVKRHYTKMIECPDFKPKVRIPASLCRYCYPLWKIAAKLHRKKKYSA